MPPKFVDPLFSCESDTLSESNLEELKAAWSSAITRVHLATTPITVVRPYSDARYLAGQYHWHDAELPKVDIGIPNLGGDSSITGEQPNIYGVLGDVYLPAAKLPPITTTQRLKARVSDRFASPERQWSRWPDGTRSLEAFLTHELAHGQTYEAAVFVPGFRARMYEAVANALGVSTIERTPQLRVESRAEAKAQRKAELQQREIREAVASEFGLYASQLPVFADPWNELWPSMVTNAEFTSGEPGPIAKALQPLRDELSSISLEKHTAYLYGRLNARRMRDVELEILETDRFDLYVVARARSGVVDKADADELLGEARNRGVELDLAYLKTSTPMSEHLPSVHTAAQAQKRIAQWPGLGMA